MSFFTLEVVRETGDLLMEISEELISQRNENAHVSSAPHNGPKRVKTTGRPQNNATL